MCGAYCQKEGAVAIINDRCGVCTGKILVKGNGVKEEKDQYGVPYNLTCEKAVPKMAMWVTRAEKSSVVVDCQPVLPFVARVKSLLSV